jgi:hypothetical protein
MRREEATMDPLWLIEGGYDAPGWRELERQSKADEIDLLMFDRTAWALLRAADSPSGYEGMTTTEPRDGMYIDPNGRAVFVVDQQTVPGPEEVLAKLGEPARAMLERVKDPVTALERLGRTY